ncbi:alpha/beta fold hydrolase [Methylosinus sporium]|uniref:alpha/beta fold hydrolase n=1 Tax=Methylosinus sporium TaxID=428 RepID=UPI001FCE4531|nr:alpha/beta hydrolase [Methylosinus sporium]
MRSRHRHDRILLVSHSSGAALGMLFAEAHPEKVAGVVCVAPVISPAEQHRREYAYNVAQAARRDDKNAQRELFEIGPPPSRTSRLVIRLQRVTERYRGVEFQPHDQREAAASMHPCFGPRA